MKTLIAFKCFDVTDDDYFEILVFVDIPEDRKEEEVFEEIKKKLEEKRRDMHWDTDELLLNSVLDAVGLKYEITTPRCVFSI